MGYKAANDEINLAGGQLGLGGSNPSPRQSAPAAPGFQALTPGADEVAFKQQLLKDFLSSSGAGTNPDTQNTLQAIQTRLATQPQLASLDPQAKTALDQITAGNQAKFDLQQQQLKQDLLNNLFGNGVQRSTIALDQGGRLSYGLGANQAQLLSDSANRELDLRKQISDHILASLGEQGKLALGGLQTRGDLLNKLFGIDVTRGSANLEAGDAERRRIQQDTQFREGNLMKLAEDRAGVQEGRKSGFGDYASQILPAALSLLGGPVGGMAGSLISRAIGGGAPKMDANGRGMG